MTRRTMTSNAMTDHPAAPPLNEAEPRLPRYAQVADDLMQRIASGVYQIGSLLPKEVELSAEYGISRHTIREALRRLDQAGLVSRRRRAGTAVLAAHPTSSYRQPINSIDDLLQYGEATDITMQRKDTVRCNAGLAKLLDCEKGREWLRVESIRTQPGDPRPICHTTMYLTLDLDDIETRVSESAKPISAIVEQVYGLRIAEIEQG